MSAESDIRDAPVDLTRLDAIATAAGDDEWRWRTDDPDVLEGVHHGQVLLHPDLQDEDGLEPCLVASIGTRAHIAAASPLVVRKLIAHIRALNEIAEAHALDMAAHGAIHRARAIRALIANGPRLP